MTVFATLTLVGQAPRVETVLVNLSRLQTARSVPDLDAAGERVEHTLLTFSDGDEILIEESLSRVCTLIDNRGL